MTIAQAFGEQHLFPRSTEIRFMGTFASRWPAAAEKDVDRFDNAALELPVEQIFQKLLDVDPPTCHRLRLAGFRFSNNNRDLGLGDQDSEVAEDDDGKAWRG